MLVINQIQTGLRLYCAIVPGCMGSDRQGLRLCSWVFDLEREGRRTLISGSPVEAGPAILYIQNLDGYTSPTNPKYFDLWCFYLF